jgi:ribosomal protein S3AE|tara:strand:- start:55 stop:201 length:147 start_codon:yes stop_codon:yes gene_type:complete
MMDRNKEIKSFISNIIDKNYAEASKHLKSVVEGKIKEKIAKATKKDLF